MNPSEAIFIDDSYTTETVIAPVRIFNGRFQQQCFVTEHRDGKTTATRLEWRDVPVIDEPDQEIAAHDR